VCEREREREPERESVYVSVRGKDRARDRERECVCMCMSKSVRKEESIHPSLRSKTIFASHVWIQCVGERERERRGEIM